MPPQHHPLLIVTPLTSWKVSDLRQLKTWPAAKYAQQTPTTNTITPTATESKPILVKVKVVDDSDFSEVELTDRTFAGLEKAIRDELEVKSAISKIRKLPNVLIKKDKDVERLVDGQELEVEFS